MRLTHYLYICAILAALSLTACDDYNDRLDGYDESKYKPVDVKEGAYTLTDADYATISTLSGDVTIGKFKNIPSTDIAYAYIPAVLQKQYPTADNGSAIQVTFILYANRTIEIVTAPFVLTGGKWIFSPSKTIDLPNVKRHETSVVFYQAACDWVWSNVDQPGGIANKGEGYVSKYGNNEYYTGSSAYDCLVDWTPANAKKQNAAAFDGMTDDQIRETLRDNLISVYAEVLATLYPDAAPVDGIDVVYTVNFTVKDGATTPHTIQYEVTGKAAFTYIEGSLTPAN